MPAPVGDSERLRCTVRESGGLAETGACGDWEGGHGARGRELGRRTSGTEGGQATDHLVLRDLSVLPAAESCEIGDAVSHPSSDSVWCISLCSHTIGL